ncbi:hypothetical protein GGF46_002410 [Coemansia sp. RSA 552]|nr:hypothetical protein GGF46_002410 [Coemansia sp. RSA 552]
MAGADDSRRVVLVTGCSAGGIGHRLALELATSHSCLVYASARNPGKVSAELAGLDNVRVMGLDVCCNDAVIAAVAQIEREAGRIDVVINNAGFICIGPVTDVPTSDLRDSFDVNVLGAHRVCRAVAPLMIRQRQGTIVNVGSVSGYKASPWAGIYCTSKAAIHMLSDALRMELRPFNVHVVVLAPGGVVSNLASHTAPTLPENSPFAPALPAIKQRAVNSQIPGKAWTAGRFARRVVPLILARHPRPYISYGYLAPNMWAMYFLPLFISDWVLSRATRVGLLYQAPAKPPSLARPLLLLVALLGALALAYFYR